MSAGRAAALSKVRTSAAFTAELLGNKLHHIAGFDLADEIFRHTDRRLALPSSDLIRTITPLLS